ncbi:hypothetical protein BGX26_004004 [Mortierella sp. AD094]|nr:hypothetical protein BGX26_004004 [Mortierella sp. AD094]
MIDLRSHRISPYEHNLVSRRSGQPGTRPLQSTPSSPTLPSSSTTNGQFRSDQTTISLRSPFRGRLRMFRISHKQQQKYSFSSDVEKLGHEGNNDQEMVAVDMDADTDVDVDVDVEVDTTLKLAQEPAIFRLSPELLALIFHYVYVTPVVHRPTTTLQNEQRQQHDASMGEMSSRQASQTSPLSSLEATTTTETTTAETMTTATTATTTASGARRKDKRKSAVYIQNDISSMLALCLTCRAFYPQAIRMLWRQRTLANYDELTEFYQAIDFSASLRKRQQKQRQIEQPLQRPGMGYAVEEGLFNNEAALRIKSLTLLDMSLGSTLPLGGVTDATSTLASSQFFGGSSSGHSDPLSAGANLDLCQGIHMLTKANAAGRDAASTSYAKDTITASSSSSSSSSSTLSKRRFRQKTTSIYSEMISPRLLHTIANHCYALVDLTICMDNKPSAVSDFPGPSAQPSIPLSIIAGTLLSLKRLTLMGLNCDPQRNKTGSELLIFAQNAQPLERISIRSCKGISVETYIEFAVRSHSRLLSLDYQGLDFETSQQLTDMMSAYANHCKNIKSVTLSCLNALSLDGMMEAMARHGSTELQELHILGHDSFRTQQQQQQQQEAPAAQPQQQLQAGGENNNNNNSIMCHLADATIALSNLSKLPLRRLTLYCPGITDFALFQYIRHSPNLVDLVLNEPTTILQHPQFQAFVQSHLSQTQGDSDDVTPQGEGGEEEEENVFGPPATAVPLAPFTSAGFFGLIFDQCPWLKYMFMKVTLETAQEWIVQPCFKEAGLDKCLYQYRTATGAPAVVLMWDARKKAIKA